MAWLAGLAFLLGGWGVAVAAEWQAHVMRVEPGGVIVVSDSRRMEEPGIFLRFYGVDVPTKGQPFGDEAQQYLESTLPRGTTVSVQNVIKEEGGSIRCMIQLHGQSLNYQMLAEGLAWVNRRQCKAVFCRRWFIQEHQAVQEKRGVWSIPIGTPPWQWGEEGEEKPLARTPRR
ncbi:MAG: thermonuclease family protein [Desulfovibrio sp.]|nr:thermonuclease family protein [Desulfovibrio sp.]